MQGLAHKSAVLYATTVLIYRNTLEKKEFLKAY